MLAGSAVKLSAMTRQLLFSVLLIISAGSFADEEEVIPQYQVEIIVFQHLYSDEAAELVSQVNDYRTVARPAPLPEPDFVGPPDPEAGGPIVELSEKSNLIQQAWNRLVRSPAHEPLHYAGWQQRAYPPEEQNPVRIHDEFALPDPKAEELEESMLDEDIADIETRVPVIDLSLTTPEEEEIDEAEFTSYRLDGQLSLVQRKYTHLEVDIEWRESIVAPFVDEVAVLPGGLAEEMQARYSLYTALQRRQVHADRLEYFDTPWLGALTLITEVEIPAEPESIEVPTEGENTVDSNAEKLPVEAPTPQN